MIKQLRWGCSSADSDAFIYKHMEVGVPTIPTYRQNTSGESRMKTGFVYILRSLKNDKFYIGSTTDINSRLRQHKTGNVKATCYLRPIELAFFKKYDNIALAHKIEMRLKRLKRRDFIEKIIDDRIIRMGV